MSSSIGFAIGNGLSRDGFDLEKLRGKGTIVGCNWLYLDFDPDYLVTLDQGIGIEIRQLIDNGLRPKWKWLTRGYDDNKQCWLTRDGNMVRPLVKINQGYNNNSGVMAAAYLSEIKRVEKLYLIGMDFFLAVPGGKNDVYGYNTRQSAGLAPVWNLLVKNNPHTEFIRVGPIADYDREFYDTKLKGMTYTDYDNMTL